MHSHLRGYPELVNALSELEKLKPDQFEIYLERKRTVKIDSKEQAIDSLTQAEDVGMSIRVLNEGKMGFSYTTSLTPESIKAAAKNALEVSKVMPQDPNNSLLLFGEKAYPTVESFDEKGLQVAVQQKIAMAKELERLCKAQDKRITAIRSASLHEGVYETHLIDTSGEHLFHRSTLFSASISCKAEQGDSAQMGGDFGFSTDLSGLNLTSVAQEAARTATELLGAGSAPTMNCPAILRNNVVSELIEFLSSSFSAEQMDKGRSMLAGKWGERLFSTKINLIDNGLLPGGYGTSPFDGEGSPCGKTTLVDSGQLTEALTDLYYSKKLGRKLTGSSSRSIKSPPSIAFSNLFIEPGMKTLDALVQSTGNGILITELMGVHTANPVTGDFSLGAAGILIENGKLTRPVQGFAVAGNVLTLFKKTAEVGNDLRFFGNVGAPSLLVSELSVGGN